MNWNAVIAICTAAAAVFTAVMAFYTRDAIKRSQQQFRDTQRRDDARHQDAYRPIVVLVPFVGIEAENRAKVVSIDPHARKDTQCQVKISCIVRNIGVGPALNVLLSFRAMGKSGYGFTQELTPAGVGAHGDTQLEIESWVQPTSTFNEADMALATGTGWELVLEYEDVFGNRFHTIHRKNPQMPWTECGKGAAPG
ncbi:MAG: hypothetical protein ACREPL_04290 [Rhodanobacteraceae bacterium]